ncbi:sulfur carrier protein ThiS [Isoptericola sp. NPDC056573]|uniref:sulfur carrier protein ThiS n=1 Tax=unclassified Isoptericola TaxID=2623355 RepID=UPI0036C7ACE8
MSTPSTSATAVVNGETYPLDGPHGDGVEAVVATLVPAFVADGSVQGIAVAVNDAVVPRGLWAGTRIAPGDRVEIVTAVQGG